MVDRYHGKGWQHLTHENDESSTHGKGWQHPTHENNESITHGKEWQHLTHENDESSTTARTDRTSGKGCTMAKTDRCNDNKKKHRKFAVLYLLFCCLL